MSGNTPQEEDIVGDRVLVGLQSVRDLPAVYASRPGRRRNPHRRGRAGPGGLQRGGESSLIAQVSLLHADEQWRSAPVLPPQWTCCSTPRMPARTVGQCRPRLRHRCLRSPRRNPRSAPGRIPDCMDPHRPQQPEGTPAKAALAGRAAPACRGQRGRAGAGRRFAVAGPASAGPHRQDVAARDLPRTLYGEHVRCVSFLSTSVRASVTPNLLAQPLNEISERRIFEAIAALTGIDHELDTERRARRNEYDRQQEAHGAESDLALGGRYPGRRGRHRCPRPGTRAASRKRPGAGGHARHGCCAMPSSVTPTSRPRSPRSTARSTRTTVRHTSWPGRRRELAEDEAFTRRQQAAINTFGKLDGDDRELGNQIATLEKQIEDADRLCAGQENGPRR